MSVVPTRLAMKVKPGHVVGYEGQWRKVASASLKQLPMGGLAVLLVWEGGGSERFRAGDLLLVLDEMPLPQPPVAPPAAS